MVCRWLPDRSCSLSQDVEVSLNYSGYDGALPLDARVTAMLKLTGGFRGRTRKLVRDNLQRLVSPVSHCVMTTPITGYAEGFYGRLLSWAERARILATLQSLGMNTYYYAPKEDPWHRFDWRTPYPAESVSYTHLTLPTIYAV